MIEITHLSKTYQSGDSKVFAVRDVSLRIEEGDFVAIMGASGSGKSTLLHLLGFLDRPDSGSYKIYGQEISNLKDDQLATLRSQLAGFVFQQFYLLSRTSAMKNVALPLIYRGKKDHSIAADKLTMVGLSKRLGHKPNQMSGGEQQRTAIARALVNDPLIIFADEPTGNLDTKSEAEVMRILKGINQQGITVIMVTHEPEVAAQAGRIIKMRDGVVIEDIRRESPAKVNSETVAKYQALLAEHTNSRQRINITSYVQQAFQAITCNKLRSFLSMLGITIGVTAVVAMSALGAGAKASIAQSLSSMGSNILTVRPGSGSMRGVSMEVGTVTRFTIADADGIANLAGIKQVSPIVRGSVRAVYRNQNYQSSVQGVGINYATMRAAVPTFGRFFTTEEIRLRRKVAVLGTTVAQALFAENNPVGERIKINRNEYLIIGVLSAKGSTGPFDQDDVILVPVTTALSRILGKDFINSIDVEVESGDKMVEAEQAIRDFIIDRHNLREKDEESFQVRNMSEIRNMLETTTKTMSMLLGVIAAISLVVGGIGIMNIMLVSVTERIKEIGLRKAIGARRRDILAQFLVEAVMMTMSGGTIGVLLGIALTTILSKVTGWAMLISNESVVMALVVSVSIGLIFGISPARRAALLNPIEALRYE